MMFQLMVESLKAEDDDQSWLLRDRGFSSSDRVAKVYALTPTRPRKNWLVQSRGWP